MPVVVSPTLHCRLCYTSVPAEPVRAPVPPLLALCPLALSAASHGCPTQFQVFIWLQVIIKNRLTRTAAAGGRTGGRTAGTAAGAAAGTAAAAAAGTAGTAAAAAGAVRTAGAGCLQGTLAVSSAGSEEQS